MTDVTSPPYPGLATLSPLLYQHLVSLRDWVQEQLGILYKVIPEIVENATTLDGLEPEKAWDGVSVSDKFVVLSNIRYIREAWDSIFREHEDTWDSTLSLQKRFLLVNSAIELLNESFVSAEVRELKEQQRVEAIAARLGDISEVLGQTGLDFPSFLGGTDGD
jgi:hypothetical protein